MGRVLICGEQKTDFVERKQLVRSAFLRRGLDSYLSIKSGYY